VKRFRPAEGHLTYLDSGPIAEHPEGEYVLFEDVEAALDARDEIAENLRGEIKDISAESAKWELACITAEEERDVEQAKVIELQKELDDAAILVSNLRAEVNALREG